MGIQQNIIAKKIKQALKKKKGETNQIIKKIDKIAIFVDEESNFDENQFKNLQRLINLDYTHFNILTYKDKASTFNKFRGAVVLKSDVNWLGKIGCSNVLDFLSESYDLLIDYTQADNRIKQLIVASIKASLVVGYADKKDELYDFMISINTKEIEIFNKEMIHYLNILKLL
jgi:hypothetical protein